MPPQRRLPGRLQRLWARNDVVAYEEAGQEAWYRPGQLLVAQEDMRRVEGLLRQRNVTMGRPLPHEDLGVTALEVGADVDIPGLARELRPDAGDAPRVAPNYVLMGEPIYQGGPGDEPVPAEPLPDDRREGSSVEVGVLDTGAWDHPWLASRVTTGQHDGELLDADGDGALDDQAGHGTFVAGVVLQQAPRARVRVARVLDSWGVGDDVSVTKGLRRLAGCKVINLSLGGYTLDDLPPLLLERAIATLPDDVVVVAAAGNNRSRRPFWPAALKAVVAVGALDADTQRAAFSNYGWWVNACAPGVDRHSTFVTFDGPREPREEGEVDDDRFEGWARWSGTSFAAPVVAGRIAALMMAEDMDAPTAAFELVGQAGLQRVPDLGAVVA